MWIEDGWWKGINAWLGRLLGNLSNHALIPFHHRALAPLQHRYLSEVVGTWWLCISSIPPHQDDLLMLSTLRFSLLSSPPYRSLEEDKKLPSCYPSIRSISFCLTRTSCTDYHVVLYIPVLSSSPYNTQAETVRNFEEHSYFTKRCGDHVVRNVENAKLLQLIQSHVCNW